MSKIFIVGGSGQIAKLLAPKLIMRGDQVYSMYRSTSQESALRSLGAIPVLGDLLEIKVEELTQLMSGKDIVIFAAGAGGKGGMEMTNAIDGKGLELSATAALKAGIQRFILVSAFPEAGRDKNLGDNFENYMVVKKAADAYLVNTDLDWVILRPGTLTNHKGTGKIAAGLALPYGNIPREDVAETLMEIVQAPQINKMIIELTEGNTPAKEAIHRLAQ